VLSVFEEIPLGNLHAVDFVQIDEVGVIAMVQYVSFWSLRRAVLLPLTDPSKDRKPFCQRRLYSVGVTHPPSPRLPAGIL